VPVGYADGFPRSVGPGWSAKLLGFDLPLAGCVSMDTMCLDASAVPPDLLARRGTVVELIGGPDGIERLAAAAGTIGYEILTRFGRRYERVYLDEDGSGTE